MLHVGSLQYNVKSCLSLGFELYIIIGVIKATIIMPTMNTAIPARALFLVALINMSIKVNNEVIIPIFIIVFVTDIPGAYAIWEICANAKWIVVISKTTIIVNMTTTRFTTT